MPRPTNATLRLELLGQIDEDLQSVHAGRKRRHDDLAGRAAEHLFERLDDGPLRAGEPAPVGVRAVGKQRQHAGRAKFGEPVEIEGLAVERRLVDLEVAGVHDRSDGRVNSHGQAVGNAVRHPQELDAKRADRDAIHAVRPARADPARRCRALRAWVRPARA